MALDAQLLDILACPNCRGAVDYKESEQVIETVAARYPAEMADFADGLTVEAGDWWFNLRPSNTEPLLRLNVEATTEAEMARVRDEVLEAVGGEPA